MSEYYKNKYRIATTRLQDFDYSADVEYFATICTKEKECFFWEIQQGQIVLLQQGKLADKYCRKIPSHFSNVILDEYIVMPNHIHGVIIIDNSLNSDSSRDAINRVSTTINNYVEAGGITGTHNPMLNKKSIPHIIRWFKGRVSFEIKKINTTFLWQSRYYDHVIKDQKSFLNIQDYIKENPLKWSKDEYNPKNKKVT